MKKFNFLENLLRREFAMSGMSGMNGLRADAVNPDSKPTVNRQSRLTSVQRHDSVTSARVAQEWLKDKLVNLVKMVMQIFATSATYASANFVGKASCESTVRHREWSRIPSCLFRYSLDSILSRFSLASLICLCMLTVGSGNVWGAENDEHEITSVAFSKLLNNNASISDVTITDPGYPVKKIVANCRYNKTVGGVTISITIGGESFGSSQTHNANSTVDLTFTDDAMTGDIVLSFVNNCGSGTGKGTFYLNSVTLVEGAAAAPTYNVYLMSGCTGGSYSSNKGTSGSGTGAYSSCTKYSGISSGTSVTITATPTSGYQFDGWTDGGYSIIQDDESNEITPSSTTSTTATFTMPSSDVVIWDCNFSETCANTMTINKGTATNCTFSLGTSGSGIASCSGVSTTVTVTPNTGYGTPSVTQSGASKTPTITGSGTSWTVTYPANTTGTSVINVSCSVNNYTITLNTDLTPTSAGTTSITATYNANTNLTSAISKPTKTGWTFGGYFTAKNGGGTQIIGADGNVIASVSGYTDASRNWKYAGNITLYAKWTCTVTWSVNEATNVYSAQTVTYNSSSCKVASVPTPSVASYCGDKFMGWTTEESVSQNDDTGLNLFSDVSGSPTITGNTTFYAVFADYDD